MLTGTAVFLLSVSLGINLSKKTENAQLKLKNAQLEGENAKLKADLDNLKQKANPEKDVLNSFRPILAYLGGMTNFDGEVKYTNFSFNVSKTDSLVSPYVGEICFDSGHVRWVSFCTTRWRVGP